MTSNALQELTSKLRKNGGQNFWEFEMVLSYPDFMNTILQFHKDTWRRDLCAKCGGTGFTPNVCCSGQGMPVDFDESCSLCGRDGQKIFRLHKAIMKGI